MIQKCSHGVGECSIGSGTDLISVTGLILNFRGAIASGLRGGWLLSIIGQRPKTDLLSCSHTRGPVHNLFAEPLCHSGHFKAAFYGVFRYFRGSDIGHFGYSNDGLGHLGAFVFGFSRPGIGEHDLCKEFQGRKFGENVWQVVVGVQDKVPFEKHWCVTKGAGNRGAKQAPVVCENTAGGGVPSVTSADRGQACLQQVAPNPSLSNLGRVGAKCAARRAFLGCFIGDRRAQAMRVAAE